MPNLLSITITGAVSNQLGTVQRYAVCEPRSLSCQFNFTYGSGGTSADAYLQTSHDGGTTWTDMANFHVTTSSARKLINLSSLTAVTTQATPTDGSLTANTAVDGIIGSMLRVKYTTVGTYAGGTTLTVDVATTRLLPQ